MANTPDVSTCNERKSNGQLPVDPWRSLAVHFGMLLGVDDFRTIGAYHRGKQWLHNGWMHREGVVWGLEPSYDEPSGEIRLERGLAIDPVGRELHLERRACIHIGRWYADHLAEQATAKPKPKPGSDREPGSGSVVESRGDVEAPRGEPGLGSSPREVEAPGGSEARPVVAPARPLGASHSIDAHVRIRFVSCLTNEVPAMVEPCDGAGRITAYSRVFETVEVELVEGLPKEPPLRYPRLRVLFGLDVASSTLDATQAQAIRDARALVQGLPPGDQPPAFVRLFHEYAALDAAELEPGKSQDGKLRVGEGVLTDVDPAWLTIATLHGLTMKPTVADGEIVSWSVESLDKLLWTNRRTHVATWDLEDLIAASLACCAASDATGPGIPIGEGGVEPGGTDVQAPAGPRAELTRFDPVTGTMTLTFDKPVSEASIEGQLDLAVFDARWQSLGVSELVLAADGLSLDARFDRHPSPVTSIRVRFGHNEPPVVGIDGWPLAGGVDEPPPLPHHGRAFVHNHGLGTPS